MIEDEKEESRRPYRSRNEHEKYWSECGGRPSSTRWFIKLGYGALIQVPTAGGVDLAKELDKCIQ